jgi:hypothetical protein
MLLRPLIAYAELARWRYHRMRTVNWGSSAWVQPRSCKRVLLITLDDRISQSQVFPFFLYRRELAKRYGVGFREMSVNAFEAWPGSHQRSDIVLLQTWFDFDHDRIRRICERVHSQVKPARVAFLDGFAHTDLRLASVLDPYIDLYVKKHLFRDRSVYLAPTLGDTTLMDYFGRRYGLGFAEVHWPVPARFVDKLVLGPGFVTAPGLVPGLCSKAPPAGARPVGVHSRLTAKGSDWYQSMREECLRTLGQITDTTVLVTPNASRWKYLRELKHSKLCYSPFGYGEVAWRDAEAVACGALLLKPDMSHLETSPDMFVPHQTYVPLKWDFSDTLELVRRYLGDPTGRERIAANAHSVARDYLRQSGFVEQMRRLFD